MSSFFWALNKFCVRIPEVQNAGMREPLFRIASLLDEISSKQPVVSVLLRRQMR